MTETPTGRWLVEGLWSAEGVGVIGGAPKCSKTWLALELAVGVASGTDVLGHFPVPTPGRVLLYGAEDRVEQLRERIEAICTVRRLNISQLDLGLIVMPTLRLDVAHDYLRLQATLAEQNPRLLILDPLVRLHRCDENRAADMSVLLGRLRQLQREHAMALILVHHLSKYPPLNSGGQLGQQLRGSGDLHAWGDSNLYLRHRFGTLHLFIEHRAALSPKPFAIELVTEPAPHLVLLDGQRVSKPHTATDLTGRVLAALAAANKAMTREKLRRELRVRNATLGEALVQLSNDGRIKRCQDGYCLNS